MRAVDVISKKRDRKELSPSEIEWFVAQAAKGLIEPYQVTAWLMSVYLNGMTTAETSALTRAMRDSGRALRFSLPSIPVDKHSTGGVGDKVSISLAPLVAACGAFNPMIAGRGLGHTGGTLDKLEAIPGFNVHLPLDAFTKLVGEIGCAIIGQTAEICPADKQFYSLRDVTGTVESLPLIVSSILSKKCAEGIGALVMDVKAGSGAFMKSDTDAIALATALVRTGQSMGLRVLAFVTDMNQPLGRTVGNALETAEAIDFLKGESESRYAELTYLLAAHMLVLSGVCTNHAEAHEAAEKAVRDGRALEKCRVMIEKQGGDPRVVDDSSVMAKASRVEPYLAKSDGFIGAMDTMRIGIAAMVLGAGREKASDVIDPAAGFVMRKAPGDPVRMGEPILDIHCNRIEKMETAARVLDEAITIAETPGPIPALVRKVIASE
jgi:pyrimidine-nucleoside phosphorylase